MTSYTPTFSIWFLTLNFSEQIFAYISRAWHTPCYVTSQAEKSAANTHGYEGGSCTGQ
jgi:hypothetical protein